MQNTSVCESFKKMKKMHLINIVYTTVGRFAKQKITPLKKHQFLHVLKGLKQGLKVQDKEKYLAFTAK